VVIFSNHPSWWDPAFYILLSHRIFPDRPGYGPMDSAALENYGFFKRVGIFGIEPDTPRGAARFLSVCQRIMADSDSMLWITAEGDFVDARTPVFGLRAETSFGHPGCWELAPSGCIDPEARDAAGRVAPVRALALELEEELGLPAAGLRRATPRALVADPGLRMVDLVYAIELDATPEQLDAAVAARSSHEYSEVRPVPVGELSGFVAANAARRIPGVPAMLRLLGWLD